MCKIPCSKCKEFYSCREFYTKNRCRACKHDKENVLTSNCKNCLGFDLLSERKPDLFEMK